MKRREIVVGCISGVYGIHGWVKIHSFTTPVDNILRYSPWELRLSGESKRIRVTVADSRIYKNGCLARFGSHGDRNAVEELVGADIMIARNRLPPTDRGEYYWTDLIGCAVVTREGIDLGRVDRLIETGANDVLVVMGDRERLIPFVPEMVILSVDPENSVIHVDWDADFT